MRIFGKINYFGDLEIAGNTLQTKTEIIVNPSDEEYQQNGYKLVEYEQYPEEKENYNIVKFFEESGNIIFVKYRYEENNETENIIEHIEDEIL